MLRVCHVLCFIIRHEVIKLIFRLREGLPRAGLFARSELILRPHQLQHPPYFWTNFTFCSPLCWWARSVIGVKLNSPVVITLRAVLARVHCVPRYNPIQPPDSCQNSLNKTKLDSNHHHHDVVMEDNEQCWQYFLPPPVTILPCYQRLPLCLYWFFVSWQKLTDGGNLPDNDDEESSDVPGGSHCQGAWAGHGGSQFIIIVLTPFSLSRFKKVYELRNHRLAVEMIFWPRP